ncbi:hypothetical protein LJ737_16925 [Hymenobacter sp. 15J16-1T3B]|uniref:hypothetical protein n=1 Tax=Hymenobacter sp. 15J16-1T3B TaxID=2886941 RepID=UPI001D124106|nr:hypothetical protein [Hymenobacter sp. 15J16-1T3B]MCC3158929.1 hypothetical protein [Hymenobacter sp. 15J16-1T3B]
MTFFFILYMLDLYLIPDSQSKSSRNLSLQRAGGIEDDLFYRLQTEGIIGLWFDYYSDFRWGSEIVVRMLLKLQQKPVRLKSDEAAFQAILQQAVDAQCGLLGLGD